MSLQQIYIQEMEGKRGTLPTKGYRRLKTMDDSHKEIL